MDATSPDAFRSAFATSAEQALSAQKEAAAFVDEQLAFTGKQVGAAVEAWRGLFALQARAAQSFGRVWIASMKPAAA